MKESEEQVAALEAVLALDPVEGCKCRTELGPDCPHVKAQPNWDWEDGCGLNPKQWLAVLKLAYPGEYDQPRPPAAASTALHQSAAVEVYRRRIEAGCHLYHPDDAWRDEDALANDVGPEQE